MTHEMIYNTADLFDHFGVGNERQLDGDQVVMSLTL